jgi:L-threonylcarbamoyladenylate synthase
MHQDIVVGVVFSGTQLLVATLKTSVRACYGGVNAVMVGGKVHAGESPLVAAARKIKEESNISVVPVALIAFRTHPLVSDKQILYVYCEVDSSAKDSAIKLDDDFEKVDYVDFLTASLLMMTLYSVVYEFILNKVHSQTLHEVERLQELQWVKDHNLDYLGDRIRHGELVAFPTETVYGLGADATNEIAVQKIFTAKGRPSDNPLIVHTHSIENVAKIAVVSSLSEKLLQLFSPGPLTVLLPPKAGIAPAVIAGSAFVSVRIPNHRIALEFLTSASVPIAAPSANKSGRPSATHHQHVIDYFDSEVPHVIKAGPSHIGVESTVVLPQNDETIRVLRQGAITVESLQAAFPICEVSIAHKGDEKVPTVPGSKYRHYSPKGTIELIKMATIEQIENQIETFISEHSGKRVALLLFSQVAEKYKQRSNIAIVLDLGKETEIEKATFHLYDYLLQCDELGIEALAIQLAADLGLGRTYNERVNRASGNS